MQLKYWELVRISWLIVWRGTIGAMLSNFLMLPVLTLGILGIMSTVGVPDDWTRLVIPWLGFFAFPLLVLPLMLYMALAKDFQGFRIQVVRPDESMDSLGFSEILRPAWTLFWMTNIVGFLPIYLLLFLLSFILSLFGRVVQVDWAVIMGAFFCYSIFIVYPLIMTLILKKRRKTFRFEVERFPATPNNKPVATS